jgi:hypothetical protein
MSVEDRIRTAIEATAATVREVRPLARPAPQETIRGTREHRLLPRWRGWLVPLAVAAAMIAVAASLVAVRNLAGTHSAPVAPAGIPRYYAMLDENPDAGGADLLVGDDITGKYLAVIPKPAKATFTGVTGAGDDRTFVVNARTQGAPSPTGTAHPGESWYEIRISADTGRPVVAFGRLPIKDTFTDAEIVGLALSPDGRTLAIMDVPNAASPLLYRSKVRVGPVTLRTYAVPSGRLLRTWTHPWSGIGLPPGEDNWADLSWLADGHTLAFQYSLSEHKVTAKSAGTFLTLDTVRPGGDLVADARILLTIPGSHTCDQGTAMLSPDGGTLLCTGTGPAKDACKKTGTAFSAFSTATGRLDRVLYRYAPCFGVNTWVAWSGPGDSAIGMLGPSSKGETVAEYMAPGKVTRLKVTPQGITRAFGAWWPGVIAF